MKSTMKKTLILIASLSLLLLSGCDAEAPNTSSEVSDPVVQEVVKNNIDIQIQTKESEIVKGENSIKIPL
jgi:uncharacterized protein YcfL